MDPVSVFGVVVNVATLIDLCVKVVGVYRDGMDPDNARLDEFACEIEELCKRLKENTVMSVPTTFGSAEANLQDCARSCIEKATALRKELDAQSPSNSRRQRIAQSVRLQFSRKIPHIERELKSLNQELDTKLLVSLRYVWLVLNSHLDVTDEMAR